MSTQAIMVDVGGAFVPLRTLCFEVGLPFTTVWGRLKKGWNPIMALSTPSRLEPGTKLTHAGGYRRISASRVSEHVEVAERAIGKPLPAGAEVHHVNGDKTDNSPHNLVICPSRAYHALLHKRQRAMEATGNPNFLKCEICGQWDDPSAMQIRKARSGSAHRTCSNRNRHLRKQRNRHVA